MDELNKERKQINDIDGQIMKLLDKRFVHTNKIGDIKRRLESAVFDNNRETSIFNKTSKYSHSPQIKVVYQCIMNESKKLQRK